MKTDKWKSIVAVGMSIAMFMTGCSQAAPGEERETNNISDTEQNIDDAEKNIPDGSQEMTSYENSEDGGHAITADGEMASYSNASVKKTGDSEGDEADFYGENAAIFATNGAKLTLSGLDIATDGTHANAVFSYGEGTVVDISDSTINTSGNCSGGLMTTGGGTMNASDLSIHTTGNSSAAIRSDRGGGTVTVTGGSYTTDGVGSPAIYSTADITVNDAVLTSTASQGVVVEGQNSVTLNNCELTADNNTHNSDKSDYYEAVMIYQSMSGDADTGLSEFTANGGSIINANGDIFFVNNTATDVSLSGVNVQNNGDGVFLRAAAAGWGKEGSNGGKVNLYASAQQIYGDMVVDDVSILNLYLKDGSMFIGAINPDGESGEVYVEIGEGSKWTLSGDSNIKSLTCQADSINLDGYTLTVDGKTYTEGTAMSGDAIEIKISEDKGPGGDMQAPPDGNGQPPQGGEGQPPQGEGMGQPQGDLGQNPPDGEPPQKPDGEPPQRPDGGTGPDDGEPPARPD